MKIRTGFVSNSSTSSFLIYGVYGPRGAVIAGLLAQLEGVETEWTKWYKGKQERWKDIYPDWYPNTTFEEWVDYIFQDGFGELLYQLSNFTDILKGIEYYDPFGEAYIGMDPRSMHDDETMAEFKQRVEKTIRPLLADDDAKFDWHELAWRDG